MKRMILQTLKLGMARLTCLFLGAHEHLLILLIAGGEC